jgi:hypothetical protein
MEPIDETKQSNVKMNINEVDNNNNLTIEDIKSMVNIIELCSQRGAFRITEFKAIGEFHERLSSFLQKKNI